MRCNFVSQRDIWTASCKGSLGVILFSSAQSAGCNNMFNAHIFKHLAIFIVFCNLSQSPPFLSTVKNSDLIQCNSTKIALQNTPHQDASWKKNKAGYISDWQWFSMK